MTQKKETIPVLKSWTLVYAIVILALVLGIISMYIFKQHYQ